MFISGLSSCRSSLLVQLALDLLTLTTPVVSTQARPCMFELSVHNPCCRLDTAASASLGWEFLQEAATITAPMLPQWEFLRIYLRDDNARSS